MYKFSNKITKVNINSILLGYKRSFKLITVFPIALFGALALFDLINILMSKKPQIVIQVVKLPQVWLPIGFFYLLTFIMEIRTVYRASHYSFEFTPDGICLYKKNNFVITSIKRSSIIEVFEFTNFIAVYYKKNPDKLLPTTIILGPYSTDYLSTIKNDFSKNGYDVVLKRSKSFIQI